MNPARQAAMAAGLPKEVPAAIVNMLCGSGLRAVVMAMQAIQCGDSEVVVAGGQESMSRVGVGCSPPPPQQVDTRRPSPTGPSLCPHPWRCEVWQHFPPGHSGHGRSSLPLFGLQDGCHWCVGAVGVGVGGAVRVCRAM